MKKIKDLIKNIKDELKGAEKYINCAIKEKSEDNDIDVVNGYIKMAQNELDHSEFLHGIIVRVITKHRAEKGEPPEVMKQIWSYEHQEYIDMVAELNMKLELLKK